MTDPITNLDDLEKRVICIISIDALDGDGVTQELGTGSTIPQRSSNASTSKINTVTSSSPKIRKLAANDDKCYFEKIIQLKKEKLKLIEQQISIAVCQKNNIEALTKRLDDFEGRLNKLETVVFGEYLDE